MKTSKLFLVLFVFLFSPYLNADEIEALKVRELVRYTDTGRISAEQYVLPVTEGYSQKNTELCWVFATLNMLEANYLYLHPTSTLRLSREFIQYLTWRDRYVRYIQGIRNFLSDRGNAIDAIKLIEEHGLLIMSSYLAPLEKFPSIKSLVDNEVSTNQKMVLVQNKLNDFYGTPALHSRMDGVSYNRKELTFKILGTCLWQTFGIKDGKVGLGDHPDPDARKETTVHYILRKDLSEKIKHLLQNGYALTVGIGGHVVMLYGAEYDVEGRSIKYYIKDSYPDYFYQADAAKIENSTWGVTTVKPLQKFLDKFGEIRLRNE